MIKIDCSEFKGDFAHLNGKNKDFIFSRWDIARAMMTIGYPKLATAIFDLGIFRFIELFAKSHTYIKEAKGGFELSNVYDKIDPSEKGAISYFIGQAFTKLFAEKKLKCDIVDNVHNQKSIINFNKKSGTFNPKLEITSVDEDGKAREPDLIGFRKGTDEKHVLEAKARNGYDKKEHQHAINQVSCIKTINGKTPTTKSACFFNVSTTPIKGIIIDPETGDINIDIDFDENKWILNYYSIFSLDKLGRKSYWKLNLGEMEFAMLRVYYPFYPLIYFGVEKNVFDFINSGKEFKRFELKGGVLEQLESKFKDFSLGPDGILLLSSERPAVLEKVDM